MAKFPPTANVLRVRTIGSYNNVNMGNRFFVNYGGPGLAAAADISALATAFGAAFMNRFGSFLVGGFSLKEVVVEDLTSDVANSASWTGSIAATGGAGTGYQGACAVISWGTQRRYRGGHPRTYLGPLTGAFITGDTIGSNEGVPIANAAIAFQTDVGTMNQPSIDLPQLGTVSAFLDKAPRAEGLFEPFTNVRVNQRLGTQRRRLGKLQTYNV